MTEIRKTFFFLRKIRKTFRRLAHRLFLSWHKLKRQKAKGPWAMGRNRSIQERTYRSGTRLLGRLSSRRSQKLYALFYGTEVVSPNPICMVFTPPLKIPVKSVAATEICPQLQRVWLQLRDFFYLQLCLQLKNIASGVVTESFPMWCCNRDFFQL